MHFGVKEKYLDKKPDKPDKWRLSILELSSSGRAGKKDTRMCDLPEFLSPLSIHRLLLLLRCCVATRRGRPTVEPRDESSDSLA